MLQEVGQCSPSEKLDQDILGSIECHKGKMVDSHVKEGPTCEV